MRICVISDGLPYDHGGAQKRAFVHAQMFHKMEGCSARLIVWNRGGRKTDPAELPANVHPVRLLAGAPRGSGLFRLAQFSLQILEIGFRLGLLLYRLRREIDIIHVINTASIFSLMAVPLGKWLRVPVILEMTSLGGDDPITLEAWNKPDRNQVFPHKPLKARLFAGADAYVSKSHALSEAYRRAGLPPDKLNQIPSGVDIQRFRPASSNTKMQLRKKLGMAVDAVVLLYLGVITEMKGVGLILEAFRGLSRKNPDLALWIVGPEPDRAPAYPENIRRNIRDWGLSDRVYVVRGMAPNPEEYLAAADIYVQPSFREGFSVSILEAMATGLAIIASDIPAISHSQISHCKEGLLVEVGDAAALQDAIQKLLDEKALRLALGQSARTRVVQHFTIEAINEQYQGLYKRSTQDS